MGERLETDEKFREQVGKSVSFMSWCTENPSACNSDQMRKAIGLGGIVLLPFIAANPGVVYAALSAQQGMRATSATIGATVNAGAQAISGNEFSGTDVMMAAATAYISSGMSMAGTIGVNTAGTVAGEIIKNGTDALSKDRQETSTKVLLTVAGTALGFKAGELTKGFFDPLLNPVKNLYQTNQVNAMFPNGIPLVLEQGIPNSNIPSTMGNSVGSMFQEYMNNLSDSNRK